jgi:proteasome regulatory subunit
MNEENNEVENLIHQYSNSEVENQLLKETIHKLTEEIERLKKVPYLVCTVKELFDNEAIIQVPSGNEFYVENLAKEKIKSGDTVLVEQKNFSIIRKSSKAKKFAVDSFVIMEKPTVKWSDVGGLKRQANEIQEVVELPLKKPELFKKVGIKPPKGVLLYGPPGTGKTLLAKAVANSTNSTFIEIVGSELVQKFIGEGAKLVKEVFQLAREKAPSVVFIDEIDALAAKRIEVGTSGEREVQRTFMQFLAELDGFKPLGDVKIIAATNRKDILDQAIVRPGRLDRLIYCGNPDEEGIKEIFKIHSKNMKIKVAIKDLIKHMKGFSGAEITATCTEAGYFAIRDNRTTVTKEDFLKAIEKVKTEEQLEGKDYMRMFG